MRITAPTVIHGKPSPRVGRPPLLCPPAPATLGEVDVDVDEDGAVVVVGTG
jgi:hypothetical protein